MTNIQTEMAIATIILFILIIVSVRKNSISVKNSIAWLLLPIVFLLIAVFPEPLAKVSDFLGFETLANFIFLITIALLIILIFFHTITISKQQTEITKLIQEIAILKKGKNDKKK